MLGKLLKQEFRATGRIMLPVFGALVLLSVLANLSIRLLDSGVSNNAFLRFISVFLIVVFGLCVFGAMLLTLWLMITRFYRNLLKDEGYLMHTLPVSVHGLVWSKLIVSLVWFIATGLVISLIFGLSALLQSGTSLAEIRLYLPSWAQLKALLGTQGIRVGDIWLICLELAALALLGFFTACLHFYAAMAMGHMFNRDKILLSIVFFVVLSFAMSLFSTMSGMGLFSTLTGFEEYTSRLAMDLAQRSLLFGILIEAVQAAILYFATTLSLRRGLNLA